MLRGTAPERQSLLDSQPRPFGEIMLQSPDLLSIDRMKEQKRIEVSLDRLNGAQPSRGGRDTPAFLDLRQQPVRGIPVGVGQGHDRTNRRLRAGIGRGASLDQPRRCCRAPRRNILIRWSLFQTGRLPRGSPIRRAALRWISDFRDEPAQISSPLPMRQRWTPWACGQVRCSWRACDAARRNWARAVVSADSVVISKLYYIISRLSLKLEIYANI